MAFTIIIRDFDIFIFTTYVDVILLTMTPKGYHILRHFHEHFFTRGLNEPCYFLDIEVGYQAQGISLSHRKYTMDFLVETSLIGCNPIDITFILGCKHRV